jgi:hypothetical protein
MYPLHLCAKPVQKVSTTLLQQNQLATPAKLAPTTTKQHRPHRPPAKFVYRVLIKISREVHHVHYAHQVKR